MDLTKLESVSTDGLTKILEAVQKILDGRIDRSIIRGRIADFKDRDGVLRTIVIRRVNRNSVSGVETGTSTCPGFKWRISKGAINVRGKEIPNAVVRPFVPAHKPATEVGDHW